MARRSPLLRSARRASSSAPLEADVLLVGAGVAGLVAARALARAGGRVVAFEKSCVPGGRCATRRIERPRGEALADHGAPCVTARHEGPRGDLERWTREGHAVRWGDGFHRLGEEGLEPPSPGAPPCWVFPRGMITLGRLLVAEAGEGLELHLRTRVARIEPLGGGWRAVLEDGREARAPVAIVNAPPEPTLGLAGAALPEPERTALGRVAMEPCFTLALGLAAPPPPWRGVRVERPSALAWIANESSKGAERAGGAGRAGGGEGTVLVLRSTPEFARARYHDHPVAVKRSLLAELAALRLGARGLDGLEPPRWSRLHRWRYARTATPLAPRDTPFVRAGSLLACGDWCAGTRVEAAWISGAATAEEVLHG